MAWIFDNALDRFCWGLRSELSLLLANGHVDAAHYTVGKTWLEARIVRTRESGRMETEAILLRAAVVDVLSGGSHLKDTLERLRDANG